MSWRLLLASLWRCLMFNNAGVQLKGHHLRIAQFPYFPMWMPLAACLLHPLSSIDFREAHTQGDKRVGWETGAGRLPGALGNQAFDRLATLLWLGIIPIPYPDKTIAVLGEELPGTLLARFAMQQNAPTSLINSSATAPGQRRAEQHAPGWRARAGIPLRVRPL